MVEVACVSLFIRRTWEKNQCHNNEAPNLEGCFLRWLPLRAPLDGPAGVCKTPDHWLEGRLMLGNGVLDAQMPRPDSGDRLLATKAYTLNPEPQTP